MAEDGEQPTEVARAEAAEAEALAAAVLARERAVRLRRQADAGSQPTEAETTETAEPEVDLESDAPAEGRAETETETAPTDTEPSEPPESPEPSERRRWPVAVGAVGVAATCVLLGTSGYLTWQHQTAVRHQQQAATFTAAAKQGVINIMSVDFQHVEADIQRLLDSSTGEFRDEFNRQAKDFIEVAKKSKVVSTGAVNSAAIESMGKDSAVVLVAATSFVTNSEGAKEDPRTWRLRVTASRDGQQIKMSRLVYVP